MRMFLRKSDSVRDPLVVVMSGEPQGALKIRQREPRPVDEFDTPQWARGSKSPFGGGGPFFWKW